MLPKKRNLQECSGFAVELRPFKELTWTTQGQIKDGNFDTCLN